MLDGAGAPYGSTSGRGSGVGWAFLIWGVQGQDAITAGYTSYSLSWASVRVARWAFLTVRGIWVGGGCGRV